MLIQFISQFLRSILYIRAKKSFISILDQLSLSLTQTL